MRPQTRHAKQSNLISWIQYMGMVLAFIGLWQLLSDGATLINRLL
jgi:hypothetical protein